MIFLAVEGGGAEDLQIGYCCRPHSVQLHLYERFRISKSIETESRLVVARG